MKNKYGARKGKGQLEARGSEEKTFVYFVSGEVYCFLKGMPLS